MLETAGAFETRQNRKAQGQMKKPPNTEPFLDMYGGGHVKSYIPFT